MGGAFLFSLDLEDVRTMIPDGSRHRDAVPEMTLRYLDVLERCQRHCTFFTVGNVARSHPDLIREIHSRGHELACHSSEHEPLDRQTPESLRRDISQNIEDLTRAGAEMPTGFRAPIASLTPESAWAHEVLADLGFDYSSSVIPVKTPLYGWPGFGEHPRRVGGSDASPQSGLWEIPMSLFRMPGLSIPFSGGIYFRLLPFQLVRRLTRRRVGRGEAVVGYLHPYDIDTEQERFMHPELGDSRLYNALMYANRAHTLRRLERLLSENPVTTYREYVSSLSGEAAAA